jgi:phosphoribosyl 1,2-cyclic phosphate phosphodiesterase
VLINEQDQTLVIDSGPDFRQQMLRENVKKLDAILFTHEHKDHIAGADDIRAFNWIYKKPMDVYAEQRVMNAIQLEYSYVFAEDKYPGVPQMTLHPIENRPFKIMDTEIIPVRGFHHQLPVFGFRLGSFAYITDINFVPDEEIAKLFGVKVLVVSALRKRKHLSHFNLDEALAFIGKVSPQISYLTHISHYMGFHEEVNKELPKNTELAYDGLQLDI